VFRDRKKSVCETIIKMICLANDAAIIRATPVRSSSRLTICDLFAVSNSGGHRGEHASSVDKIGKNMEYLERPRSVSLFWCTERCPFVITPRALYKGKTSTR
jgi:hypothetical protein